DKVRRRSTAHLGDAIVRRLMALLLCVLALTSLVIGQVPSNPAFTKKEAAPSANTQTAREGVHEMTAADVEVFLDGIVHLQLSQTDIAGATVSIVKDGKLLFVKGYGYADVQKKQFVSGPETLFRPGSISKLFTWTAIMQLFEQGKL